MNANRWLLPLAAFVLCACPAPVAPGVAISPESVDLEQGGTVTFTATVTKLSNPAVTWAVDEANGGTISEEGVYVAPSAVGTFHVTATSVEDSKYSAKATINVTSPSIRVAVGPAVSFIAPTRTVLFTATVTGLQTGEAPGVNWSVEEAGGGSVDANGVYTAPAAAGTYHVVASSKADVTKTGRGTVTVDANPIIPLERITVFSPGLNGVGGIPQRNTIFRTLAPSGADDTMAIQQALDACPENQVVKLGPGTFNISGNGLAITKSRITLRGSGPAVTRLTRTDTADFPIIIIGSRYSAGKTTQAVALASDGVKDSYSVTLASAPNPALTPGELVIVDSLTDPNISLWSPASPPGHASRGWFSRMDRPLSQVLEVASASGTTVNFTTPLHANFPTAFQAELARHGQGTSLTKVTSWSGIEDLYVEKGRGGDGGGNIHLFVSSYCWVKNIESYLNGGGAVQFNSTFRCALLDSHIHQTSSPNPGGGGYLLTLNKGAADNLVENNTIWGGNKVIVMRASGGGNVIAYNLAQDAYGAGYLNFIEVGLNAAHMTTAHHELFEGNESFNFDADFTWGNAVHITVLRNSLTGLRAGKAATWQDTGNRRAAGLTWGSWWYSFYGNVLGSENMVFVGGQNTWDYEAQPGLGSASGFNSSSRVPMWKLGYDSGDFNKLADPKVLSTVIRHGNFDYVTNQQAWDPNIASRELPRSLYLAEKPAFMGDRAWPWVEPGAATAAERVKSLPAKERFNALP